MPGQVYCELRQNFAKWFRNLKMFKLFFYIYFEQTSRKKLIMLKPEQGFRINAGDSKQFRGDFFGESYPGIKLVLLH